MKPTADETGSPGTIPWFSVALVAAAALLNAPLVAIALGAIGPSALAVGFVVQVAGFIWVWRLVVRMLPPAAGKFVLALIATAYLVATVWIVATVRIHV